MLPRPLVVRMTATDLVAPEPCSGLCYECTATLVHRLFMHLKHCMQSRMFHGQQRSVKFQVISGTHLACHYLNDDQAWTDFAIGGAPEIKGYRSIPLAEMRQQDATMLGC